MEITKKKVVKSVYYYKDIQDIFEYGEATFGEKAALSFFDELLISLIVLNRTIYFIQNVVTWRPNQKNTGISFLAPTSSFTGLPILELKF